MGNFTHTTTVGATPDAVFAFLADVRNLPRYFDRMTSAEPGDGREVKTTARLPDGRDVHGAAWFTVDDARQRIEWGAESDSGYHGHLDVRASGDGAEVEVHLHTERVDSGDEQIERGLEQTLANIERLIGG